MEKQSAMELLQLVGQVGAALQGAINIAPVVGWSIKKLMSSMGVPDDVTKQMEQQPAMMPSSGPDNPASNPMPESPEGAGPMADMFGGGGYEAAG